MEESHGVCGDYWIGSWEVGFSGDLTGSFCTKRDDRNWLGKELRDAEEATYAGADCDAAAVGGLKVPRKQRPRSRLWLNDGSCIRLRQERRMRL